MSAKLCPHGKYLSVDCLVCAKMFEIDDRLREENARLRDMASRVTSYIRVDVTMEGPRRLGVNHGGGLRRAIYELDDALKVPS